jgi:hypothetical protein
VAFIGTREMKPSFKKNEESEIVYLDANVILFLLNNSIAEWIKQTNSDKLYKFK